MLKPYWSLESSIMVVKWSRTCILPSILPPTNNPCCVLQVNPLFGTIYNGIYLLAKSISNARRAGMRLSGSNLAYSIKNTTFSGFNQKVKVNTGGQVKTSYIILDTDNTGSQLYPTYVVDLTAGVLRLAGRSIYFPGGSPPPSDSSCWFVKSAVCTGGKSD